MQNSEIFYYEQTASGFELWLDGEVVFARSFSEMTAHVESPCAEFTEVGQHNWQALYDAGAFDV